MRELAKRACLWVINKCFTRSSSLDLQKQLYPVEVASRNVLPRFSRGASSADWASPRTQRNFHAETRQLHGGSESDLCLKQINVLKINDGLELAVILSEAQNEIIFFVFSCESLKFLRFHLKCSFERPPPPATEKLLQKSYTRVTQTTDMPRDFTIYRTTWQLEQSF